MDHKTTTNNKEHAILMDYILTRPPVNAGCKSRQNSTLGWSSEPNRPPAALFFSRRPTRRLSVTSPIGLDFGQGTVDTYQSISILPFAHTLFMPLQSLTTNSSSPLQVDLSLTLMPATTDALWRRPAGETHPLVSFSPLVDGLTLLETNTAGW